MFIFCIFFFKQKTAYEMRISDWSSDVCSSDLLMTDRSRRDGKLNGCVLKAAVTGGRFERSQRGHGWKSSHCPPLGEMKSSVAEDSEFVEPSCGAHLSDADLGHSQGRRQHECCDGSLLRSALSRGGHQERHAR